MKQEIEKKRYERRPPSLAQQVKETIAGLIIMGAAGLGLWQDVLSEMWAVVVFMLGAWHISKSLVADFFKALPEWLRR